MTTQETNRLLKKLNNIAYSSDEQMLEIQSIAFDVIEPFIRTALESEGEKNVDEFIKTVRSIFNLND